MNTALLIITDYKLWICNLTPVLDNIGQDKSCDWEAKWKYCKCCQDSDKSNHKAVKGEATSNQFPLFPLDNAFMHSDIIHHGDLLL